jgi:hypothetical protein
MIYERGRTVSLSRFDFLEQALEPTEGRSISADPEKFDTTERSDVTTLLPVPDVLEDGGKRSNT